MPEMKQPVPDFVKDPEKLRALLTSPEVRQLAALLNARSGGGLQQAAQSAKAGDASQLQQMMQRFAATPEGARLLEQLQGKLGK